MAEQKEEVVFPFMGSVNKRSSDHVPLKPTANRQPVPQARQWQSPEHLPHISVAGSPGSQTGLVAKEAWAGGLHERDLPSLPLVPPS